MLRGSTSKFAVSISVRNNHSNNEIYKIIGISIDELKK